MTSWWSCPCARDAPDRALEPSRAHAPQLLVTAAPSSALAPLVFTCSSCTLRIVACEGCHIFIDVAKQTNGALRCRRCGVLTLLDPTLRSLLALPACDQSFLKRVSFVLAPVVRLHERIAQCHAQSTAAESSEPSGEATRKRSRTDASPLTSTPIAPSSELMALQRELGDVKRQWELFASAAIEAPTPPTHQHATFSATHLHIEHFLAHQSALLMLKLDVLAAIETCRASAQLHAPVFQVQTAATNTHGVAAAARVVRNMAQEQLAHRYRAHQTLAQPHLALVSTATQQLEALVATAQELRRATSEPSDAAAKVQRTLFRPTDASPSHSEQRTGPRSHRRFGTTASLSATAGRPGVSVQQSLAAGHRWSELAKRAELWRALSATVASTCVLSVSELAAATPVPLPDA